MIRLEYLLFVFFFLAGFAHQLLYVLFPLFALDSVLRNKFELPESKATNLFLIFFLFVFALFLIQSTYLNQFNEYGIKGVFRYFAYFCLAIFLSYIDRQKIDWILERIIQIFLILIPYALIEVIIKERYVFVFHHSNNLAYLLILLLVFAMNSNYKWKWLYYAGLAFSILLTKSSGGALTMIILTTIHLFFFEKIPLNSKIITFFSIVSLLAVGLLLFPERILEQWNAFSGIDSREIFYRAHKHWFGSHGSGVWRITYWIAILSEFFKSPLIVLVFGNGLDSMTFGNYAYSFMNIDPHNDYVKLITEFGIAGLCFFVYFIYGVSKIVKTEIIWIIAMLLPMYFGNILVNFPYMYLYITVLTYKSRSEN